MAIIDQFGVLQRNLLLVVQRVAVDGDTFQRPVRLVENRPAGGLVCAATFNADQAVFDKVNLPDGMLSADSIEFFDELMSLQPNTVDRNGNAGLEVDLNITRFGRGLREGH